MRRVLGERGDLTQRRERGLAKPFSIVEHLLQDDGDHLSAADRGVLDDTHNMRPHESFTQ